MRPQPLVAVHDVEASSRWYQQLLGCESAHGRRDRHGAASQSARGSARRPRPPRALGARFVHIRPDETETISRIPGELLFPAPGLPEGNVLMGYDENGHCPMFEDGRCSIYDHRPRTCRTYDCRVLPAAGLELDDDDKARITERTRRWRFDLTTPQDRTLQAAVQAAATFLRNRAHVFPEGTVPRNAMQLAYLAIRIHDVFLERGVGSGEVSLVSPPLEVVVTVLSQSS